MGNEKFKINKNLEEISKGSILNKIQEQIGDLKQNRKMRKFDL